jgi:hypothetical protein
VNSLGEVEGIFAEYLTMRDRYGVEGLAEGLAEASAATTEADEREIVEV